LTPWEAKGYSARAVLEIGEEAMFEEDEAYAANHERLKAFADREGYDFNADAERVNKVIGLMTRNLEDFGSYYCPCKQSHPLEPDKDVLCPCPEAAREIAEEGHCFCRLFYKRGPAG
jgi:ferredoxin-thioredoxin reductase catalytic chain